MEAFLVSLSSVAIAEIGDRTQLLSLVLAAHYRKPWPILAGVLLATLANHAAAGLLGQWFAFVLTPPIADLLVGASMLAMAIWTLRPDTLEAMPRLGRRGAFLATLIAFFIAEIGDKTQIATAALAAACSGLTQVVLGTTLGMLIANAPVVFLGKAFADRLPLRRIHQAAALLFLALGAWFLIRALTGAAEPR
ncbi:MAG: TMEM165/GDT1 family protein [Proteobacteria bacterium]|nr:TMEM165/GDT1 family protein [Pseudomonadota bacterium]MBI3499801.1 TMEM165/GDT1 family protein [Pseudomonadota bacterium]